ncbi:MAG: nickel pincer cofactor biosynthesis protein LarC [Cyanobacteria bacterium J069]
MIIAAGLPPKAEAWSLAVFRQLAIAESAVHGIPLESVHFHEVGATDAIVDIVGTCLGLDWLGVEQLYCSAMPTGGGTIWAAHGRLPVPAPAVLKLWEMRQVPIYSNGIERELVTPTGAAIATTLAADFGPPPAMTLTCVGLGAGGRELPIPNILRLWIGETVANWSTHRSANSLAVVGQRHAQAVSAVTPISATPLPNPSLPDPQTSGAVSVPQPAQPATEAQVIVLETQIDDANPQAIAYTLEALLAAGALDVFMQPVTMKKSRLGTLITVICSTALAEDCRAILFRETTTLGIRESVQQRTILDREFHSIPTDYGLVTIKLGKNPLTGELLNVQPEYEDCARIARDRQVAWTAVHQAALDAWQIQNPQATH